MNCLVAHSHSLAASSPLFHLYLLMLHLFCLWEPVSDTKSRLSSKFLPVVIILKPLVAICVLKCLFLSVTPASHLMYILWAEVWSHNLQSFSLPTPHIHCPLLYFLSSFLISLYLFRCSCWLRLDTYFIWSFIGPATLIIMVSVTPPTFPPFAH